MAIKYAALGISCAVALLVIALAMTNQQQVPVSLFGHPQQISECFLMLAGIVGGALAGVATGSIFLGRAKTQGQKLNQWQVQDAKLIAQVKSDREKQLEAKIATLESALKAALRRS